MAKVDPTWLIAVSDLFINLSAGWFGAAFIVLPLRRTRKKISTGMLTVNIVFAIVSLLIGYQLKKFAGL